MPDWKNHGLRIIRSGELDSNTPQTPGMSRAEAISHARVGAQKLSAGPWWFIPMPRPVRIMMESWKRSSMWCVAARGFAGEII